MSDEELGAALLQKGSITTDVLQKMRSTQAADVLRVAILWTAGEWSYERRVRIAADLRVPIDITRLLLESARRLPLAFIKSRVGIGATKYSIKHHNDLPLSPTESLALTRVTAATDEVSLADLATKGLSERNSLRSVYALCVAGVLYPGEYQTVLSAPKATVAPKEVKEAAPPVAPIAPDAEVNALFSRLNSAKSHYDVLDVGHASDLTEIKRAYHELARRFHPDRFHQSDLRAQVESAFARIGRAYETLSDAKRRKEYDRSLSSKQEARPVSPSKTAPAPGPTSPGQPEANRAETSFKLGTEALERDQHEAAVRLFAEAATLEPRVAKYRAYYGSALMRNPSLRRTAETELQAALKLEPNNPSFRVMLAELYQQVGLRKRAEQEAMRALAADSTNKPARELLSNLSRK
jgi:curved DNA-binding protein CbpA